MRGSFQVKAVSVWASFFFYKDGKMELKCISINGWLCNPTSEKRTHLSTNSAD